MILGTGTDIVSVARIRAGVERHGERFLQKIFTRAETDYCLPRARKYEHLAARFAAKEALLKALGTGAGPEAALADIEVVRDPRGKPSVRLHGRTARFAEQKAVQRIHLSLAHESEFAVAHVILEDAPSPSPPPAPALDILTPPPS